MQPVTTKPKRSKAEKTMVDEKFKSAVFAVIQKSEMRTKQGGEPSQLELIHAAAFLKTYNGSGCQCCARVAKWLEGAFITISDGEYIL